MDWNQSYKQSGPVPIFWLGNMEHYGRIAAMKQLGELASQGKIEIIEFHKSALRAGTLKQQILEIGPAAIVQRPTTWPIGDEEPLPSDFPRKCFIVNLAVGSEHLKRFHEEVPDWLLLPNSNGTGALLSAKAVAQLTVVLAVCLQRRLIPAAALASDSEGFHNQHEPLIRADSLFGTHWLCLAGGKQVRELLPLLKDFGVAKVTIWDRELEPMKFRKRFATCTELVRPASYAPELISSGSSNRAKLFVGDFMVEFTNDYESPAREADIISIHASGNNPRPNGARTAKSPFPLGDAFFSLMKSTAYFINPARGKLVDEDAAVRHVNASKMAGYGTDVLYPAAELNADSELSPFWKNYRNICGARSVPMIGGPNIVVLPHTGGSLEKVFAAFLEELVPRMLAGIGIAPQFTTINSLTKP